MTPHDASEDGRRRTIVFGQIQDPARALLHAASTLPNSGRLGPAIARVAPGEAALRLNSSGWLALPPQSASDFATHAGRIAACRDALLSRSPLFARPLRAFLSNYTAFAGARIEAERAALQARLARSGITPGSVLDPRDFVFSAYLPLPNAYLQRADGSFVHVDCAFWTGRTLLAIRFAGLTMPRPSEAAAVSALEEEMAELRVLRIAPAAEGDVAAFDGPLTEHLGDFTDGLALPFGPFRLPQLSELTLTLPPPV